MLATPLTGKGDRVEVDLGPELTVRLKDYCKIVGDFRMVALHLVCYEEGRQHYTMSFCL